MSKRSTHSSGGTRSSVAGDIARTSIRACFLVTVAEWIPIHSTPYITSYNFTSKYT